jgi:hypothetical protein
MAMTLITTNTSSNATSSSFTSSIDNTYKLYIFKFYDVNPATDNVKFQFQGSSDTGSSYGVTKTTTSFASSHNDADSSEIFYNGDGDLAQSTSAQELCYGLGNGGDESLAGEFHLFNPSNTTYIKHFYAKVSIYMQNDGNRHFFTGGYFNTTSVIDAMQFTMTSGNMDAVIKMYGVG